MGLGDGVCQLSYLLSRGMRQAEHKPEIVMKSSENLSTVCRLPDCRPTVFRRTADRFQP